MFTLTMQERDRRWKTVRKAMEKRSLGALLVWGSFGSTGNHGANFRYLSNARLEGYIVFPAGGDPCAITFSVHFRKGAQPWIADFRAGHPAYSLAMAQRLKELRLESQNIGLVGLSGYYGEMGFPHSAYVALARELPRAHFEDATGLVADARKIKSPEELTCLENGCQAANRVFQTVAATARVGANDYEVRGRILDTLIKEGCDADSMVMYCSGKEITHAGQGTALQTTVKLLEDHDVILTEFDPKYVGYKAQHNQPFSVGQPDKEWSKLFSTAAESFESAFKMLRPGVTAGELDEAFLSPIKKAGYGRQNPAFHGIGLSLEDPIGSFPMQPSHTLDSTMVLETGMVFEFEPHVVTPDEKKGVHLGCPVLVTETGCRLLNPMWQPEFKVV